MADPSWLPGVKAVFDAAGIPPEVWVPIMLHESAANPNAEYNTTDKPLSSFKPGILPEWSVGLFQINVHAWAVKPDGTRVHTAAEEAAYAAQLKDPIQSAKVAAARMAPAWAYVQGLPGGVNKAMWAGAVGIRSGWPAGSVANPCLTDYCGEIMQQFAGVFTKWANAINLGPNFAAGSDIITPYFTGSATGAAGTGGGNGNAGGADTGGQSATNSVTTAPGYYAGAGGSGAASSVNASGSASTSPTATSPGSGTVDAGAWFQALLGGVETQATKDFHAWLQTDAALSLLFFVAGGLLLFVAVVAILFEGQKNVNAQAVKVLGLDTTKGKGATSAALVSGA